MKKTLLIFFAFIFSFPLFAGTGWTVSDESSKRFIENKSQFDVMVKSSPSKILFAVDWGKTKIFFTAQGLTYRFDNPVKNKGRKKGSPEPKYIASYDLVYMQWENASPNVQVIAEEQTSDYFSYCISKEENINYIKAYKKLIYKNLYPGIDAVYEFHETDGIKYSLILHPGADASQIKMKYSKNVSLDKEGNIRIPTKFGDIIDHAPYTFYSPFQKFETLGKVIPSMFIKNGNAISFSLGNYDHAKTIVIDPWTQTPALANSNGVWECDRDGAGNVYIIGGDSPMKLQKYNSAGAIQWTYNTPWDTVNNWLGTLATDLAGNSYVTSGSSAAIQKINTSGSMLWNAAGSNFDEYWSLSFNCDQTKLIAGGTRLKVFPSLEGYGCAFNINLNNGTVSDTLIVASITTDSVPFIINNPNEIRTICSSPNGGTYFLTLDTMGYFNSSSFASLFTINSGYNFSYKCEIFRPNNGNGGISSIKANGNFIYTQNGTNIQKRSLVTGAVITAAAIPGGISIPTFGGNQVGNSGIDIDSCGNIYVGSANAVIKYDANLSLLTSLATPYAVSDVAVSYNGEIIVCGTTGTSASASRTGYVQSINMSACAPMDTFCSDSSVVSVPFYADANGWNLILQNIPSGNELAGTLFATSTADVLVKIIDMQGKIIKTKEIKISKGTNSFHVDLNVNGGVYVVTISDSQSNRQLIKKFVKL